MSPRGGTSEKNVLLFVQMQNANRKRENVINIFPPRKFNFLTPSPPPDPPFPLQLNRSKNIATATALKVSSCRHFYPRSDVAAFREP